MACSVVSAMYTVYEMIEIAAEFEVAPVIGLDFLPLCGRLGRLLRRVLLRLR